ncbi:hypothetical protein ACFL5K_05345 [Gemmatimonadota bacterium]
MVSAVGIFDQLVAHFVESARPAAMQTARVPEQLEQVKFIAVNYC